MRVISGSAKGRRLSTLEGLATRPTADKVKESLFNIIQTWLPGAVVLDVFAGSGALGIEAISRGADLAVFIDKSGPAVRVINSNLKLLGFESRAHVYRGSASELITDINTRFDIVFIDPPYTMPGLYNDILEGILKYDILNFGGIVCAECAAGAVLTLPSPYQVLKNKRYGSTQLLVAKLKEDDDERSHLSGQF